MATYDRLDWHLEAALEAGQPAENAFTHIGLYLAWVIRRDLFNPEIFPPEIVAAVKSGQMRGSDLVDYIDTKLLPEDMNADGKAFSDARYRAYMADYEESFKDVPIYGVGDEPVNYDRVERLLDALFRTWLADGRPKPEPPEPPEPHMPEGARSASRGMSVLVPDGFDERQLDDILAALKIPEITVVRTPTEDEMPHISPELEALIPRDLTTPPMRISSTTAARWGDPLLKRALKHLDVKPSRASVVIGMGGDGPHVLTVTIYGVAGVPAELLDSEFRLVIFRRPGSKWERREVSDKTVNWATGREFNIAYWALAGMVFHVGGQPAEVVAAISRLP